MGRGREGESKRLRRGKGEKAKRALEKYLKSSVFAAQYVLFDWYRIRSD